MDWAARILFRLPPGWTSTARRRRILFLAGSAPGFLGVFATPLHQNLLVALTSFGLFGAAVLFRRTTEPGFVALSDHASLPAPSLSQPAECSHEA